MKIPKSRSLALGIASILALYVSGLAMPTLTAIPAFATSNNNDENNNHHERGLFINEERLFSERPFLEHRLISEQRLLEQAVVQQCLIDSDRDHNEKQFFQDVEHCVNNVNDELFNRNNDHDNHEER